MGHAAFQHFHHFALGLAAAGGRPGADLHFVAILGVAQAAAGDEYVVGITVEDDEGGAGAGHVDHALGVGFGGFLLYVLNDLVFVVAVLAHETVAYQLAQGALDAVLRVFDFQLPDELLRVVLFAGVEL